MLLRIYLFSLLKEFNFSYDWIFDLVGCNGLGLKNVILKLIAGLIIWNINTNPVV